jgi:hypothetical protein
MAATRAKPGTSMWVVILEIVLALGLAVFIVWWTWPKKRDEQRPPPPDKPVGKDQ